MAEKGNARKATKGVSIIQYTLYCLLVYCTHYCARAERRCHVKKDTKSTRWRCTRRHLHTSWRGCWIYMEYIILLQCPALPGSDEGVPLGPEYVHHHILYEVQVLPLLLHHRVIITPRGRTKAYSSFLSAKMFTMVGGKCTYAFAREIGNRKEGW